MSDFAQGCKLFVSVTLKCKSPHRQLLWIIYKCESIKAISEVTAGGAASPAPWPVPVSFSQQRTRSVTSWGCIQLSDQLVVPEDCTQLTACFLLGRLGQLPARLFALCLFRSVLSGDQELAACGIILGVCLPIMKAAVGLEKASVKA